jgi:hypothetical protein
MLYYINYLIIEIYIKFKKLHSDSFFFLLYYYYFYKIIILYREKREQKIDSINDFSTHYNNLFNKKNKKKI